MAKTNIKNKKDHHRKENTLFKVIRVSQNEESYSIKVRTNRER